jgi:hypothetical protein
MVCTKIFLLFAAVCALMLGEVSATRFEPASADRRQYYLSLCNTSYEGDVVKPVATHDNPVVDDDVSSNGMLRQTRRRGPGSGGPGNSDSPGAYASRCDQVVVIKAKERIAFGGSDDDVEEKRKEQLSNARSSVSAVRGRFAGLFERD